MAWSAAQYVKFEAERTRAVHDLLSAVPSENVRSAIDLGCGPGNSTQVLASCYPAARVSGLDSDPDMIAAARERMPDMRFTLATLNDWRVSEKFDVILSNAVLHWIPDHETLLPRLIERLHPRGSLAIQMPKNLDQPSHRAMCTIADQPKWAHRLSSGLAARTMIHDPSWYYERLGSYCGAISIWQTTYYHHLRQGLEGIVEWFKGSALRPFLAVLDPAEQEAFLNDYREALAAAYPALGDGSVILPFPRLFIVATHAAD